MSHLLTSTNGMINVFHKVAMLLFFIVQSNVVLTDINNCSPHRLALDGARLIAVDNLYSCHVRIINCTCTKIIFSLSNFPCLEV